MLITDKEQLQAYYLTTREWQGIPGVAVTKSGSDEELLALASFGAAAIGENRPSELSRRGELLRAAGYMPELHEIGTLQSNKAKLVCPIATLIHSLDSLSLAKELCRVKVERFCDILGAFVI